MVTPVRKSATAAILVCGDFLSNMRNDDDDSRRQKNYQIFAVVILVIIKKIRKFC